MKTENTGRVVGVVLMALLFALVGGIVSEVLAANREPPEGWFMSNRDRAKWAMGRTVVYLAHASANTTLPTTGLEANDTINAIVDVETAGSWALLPITTTLTVSANSIVSSGTPYTAGNMYMVVAHRRQADAR